MSERRDEENRERARHLDLTELDLTPEEEASKAVGTVLRDESLRVTVDYVAMAKSRMSLINRLYDNTNRMMEDIFEETTGPNGEVIPAAYSRMTANQKLNALGLHLRALNTMQLPIDDQREIMKQINVQINNVFNTDPTFKSMSPGQRDNIRRFMLKLMKPETEEKDEQ